jgi:hypothetical protein
MIDSQQQRVQLPMAEVTAGCLAVLLVFAFYAACTLILIALAVWAWHYLFG